MLQRWNAVTLECCNAGMLQCWNAATLECYNAALPLLLTRFFGPDHQNANACDFLAAVNAVWMG